MSEEAKTAFARAQRLENAGRNADSIPLYEQAAKNGHGLAAKNLAEIYEQGKGGIPRDYGKALQWYAKAEGLGIDIPRYACR